MKFLERITVPRAGRSEDEFVVRLTDDEARERLCFQKVPHTLVEFLACPDGEPRMASPGKFYLDRDVYLGPDPPSQELLAFHKNEVVANVRILVDVFAAANVHVTCKIATRHGFCLKRNEHKASFRPFLLGMRLRYTDILRIIKLKQPEGFWDESVYKPKEQLLAAINGCKGQIGCVNDTRVLTPECPTDDPLDYVVQHVLLEWPFLDLPEESVIGEVESEVAEEEEEVMEEVGNDAETSRNARSMSLSASGPENPFFVRDLLACLSKATSDNRESWIRIGYILRGLEGAGEGYWEDFLRFSKIGTDKFDGERECRKAWDSFRAGNRSASGSCTIASLVRLAKIDDPAAYEVARRANNKRKRDAAGSVIVSRYMIRDEGEFQHAGQPMDGDKFVTPRLAGLRLPPQSSLVLTAMQDKFPEHFDHLNAEHFKAEAGTNMQLKLSEPSNGFNAIMSHPDCAILLEGQDRPLCSLAGEFQLKHLGQLNTGINNDTVFACSRTGRGTQDITKFSAQEPDGTIISMTVYNAFNGRPIVPQLKIRGKDTKVNLTQAKMLATMISEQATQHLTRTMGSGAVGWFNIGTLNVNTQINVGMGAGPKRPSEFAQIRVKLEAAGILHGLRKEGGHIYVPIPGCPCAYIIQSTYEDFINTVLEGNEVFKDNPRRFDESVGFLTKYKMPEIPWFKPDLDILSFSNGVLQLGSVVFTPYEGMDLTDADGGAGGLASRVARHHIPYPYTGLTDTPLLDLILDFQFDSDVKELLYALIGRCFFKIGLRDGWQVMLFLVGVGGTGKSLVLNIVDALFADGKVGNLAAKREEVFGMANLVTKELVLGRDMPAKMSASLPQEIMQSMTAGEGMEIPRKGLEALQVRWTAPVIMAGNHMPDYTNTGNNIGRRMVSIRFDNVVANTQDDLQERILKQELPNIVCRALAAYKNQIDRVKASGGFWKAVPPVVLEWRSRLAASTNKLEEFLTADDDTRGCTIERVEGRFTSLSDFKAVYERKIGGKDAVKYVEDAAVFQAHGFFVSQKMEFVCKSCKQLSKGRPKCCTEYSDSNRWKKTLIHNMVMGVTASDVKDVA